MGACPSSDRKLVKKGTARGASAPGLRVCNAQQQQLPPLLQQLQPLLQPQHPQLQLLLQLHPQLQPQPQPFPFPFPLPQPQPQIRMMIRMIQIKPLSLFHIVCVTSLISLKHTMLAGGKRQLDH